MEKAFMEAIEHYRLIDEGDTIIIGLSGGADSVCLLHLLHGIRQQLNLKLIAVHVNHCLRGALADSDQDFCKQLCQKLDICFEAFQFNAGKEAKENGITVEEAGRNGRYATFNSMLEKYNGTKIAVAHNSNDQAETFLIRLFRGTGTKGLAAMREKNVKIIRPLLFFKRSVIEQYCLDNMLSYVTDASNYDTIYTRNNIRLNILPLLEKEFNPNIIDILCRTSNILGEESRFIDKLADELFVDCAIDNDQVLLDIDKLSAIDIVLRRRIVRKAISRLGGMRDVSFEHIEAVLALMKKESGKRIYLPNKICIYKQYNFLYISKNDNTIDYSYDIELFKDIFIAEPRIYARFTVSDKDVQKDVCTKSFDYDKIKCRLQIRNRRPGDNIHINGCGKKLKKYFSDEKIPLNLRNTMPLIADGQNILWLVGDKRQSDLYKVTDDTKNILLLELWEAQNEKS